ncbi:hypothetical protein [Halorientalis salina]|uniref:hypothetical protein n=1 Tax=Halorientalis salina TaxID=2932266 RepID=UPI0010AD9346|nr:hypothetical protein [Halorientalis salina]
MIRRTIPILLLAIVLTAGCVSGPGGSPTDTDSSPPTSTDAPTTEFETPGADAAVEWPDGPKAQPERPDDLTTESVRSYLRTHEYRYVYNSLWYGEYTNVSLDCSVESVESAGDGYRGVVSCTGYSNTRGEPSGTETVTEIHADWFTQTFVYYVDDDTVRRTRAEG